MAVAASTTAGGALARPGDLGQEVGVDLGAVEVGHHHAGRQLGDLSDHADEDGPAHPGAGGPAEGDAGEVADLHDAHRGDVGPGGENVGL